MEKKGKAACNPNSIRADKVESFVFNKISDLCNNEKAIDEVLNKISNKEGQKLDELKNN